MRTTFKSWSGLGLSAALSVAVLAGCGPIDQSPAEPAAADEKETVALAAGQGGEGEGGVSMAEAATDPVTYTAALAIAEAHVLAARDAFAAGETEAAAEMFAHPVAEVLLSIEPVLKAQGVVPFDAQFTEAANGVLDGESVEQVTARADAIVATIRKAASMAPVDGTSPAMIAAGVAADQIERAAAMYRAALDSDLYGPYLDGFGFYLAGKAAFEAAANDITAENAEAASAIKTALAELEAAYPTATKPKALVADPAALAASASQVSLALSGG